MNIPLSYVGVRVCIYTICVRLTHPYANSFYEGIKQTLIRPHTQTLLYPEV